MFRPTSKAEVSTIAGTRGAWAMSVTRFRAPRTRLIPAVSMTAFAEAGFSSGTLLGANASVRFSTRKWTRSASRQSRSASLTRSSANCPVAR